ncbi:hypothetical protein [Wolbachia endosymbiont of Pentidionis agamae]|uniref:hypothetical protein n=1 Tax=Wolbachia endosymbiont of Pentidionis agamae TaxID=3110435 RepID=UPI002FD25154
MNKEKQVNLLLKNLSTNTNQVNTSLILERIEKLSNDSHGRTIHDNHCNFSRSGGGHGNVCYSWKEEITLIKNRNEKDEGMSR